MQLVRQPTRFFLPPEQNVFGQALGLSHTASFFTGGLQAPQCLFLWPKKMKKRELRQEWTNGGCWRTTNSTFATVSTMWATAIPWNKEWSETKRCLVDQCSSTLQQNSGSELRYVHGAAYGGTHGIFHTFSNTNQKGINSLYNFHLIFVHWMNKVCLKL
jgi:hypothetical protein